MDPSLLGEPAWDILLDLFIRAAAGRPVSVTSSALASGVPSTTALRYFDRLEGKGMISRRKSPTDGRVTFVDLTAQGHREIGACLEERAKAVAGRLPLQPAQSGTEPECRERRVS